MNRLVTKISITLSICALLSHGGQAQISGTVTDNSNQPVSYATVALLNAHDSTLVKGEITDEQGNYMYERIDIGKYLVRISYVGYQEAYSSYFDVKDQQEPIQIEAIQLQEATQSLEEVTVTAQRSLIEKRPDRLIMNLDNSILTKGNTADQLLKMAPLVSTSMSGKLSLRGKTNVMILIDGKQVPETTLSMVLQNMPADQIEKLEIITNPSAKYDAAASGGVINIITKEGLEKGFNGTYRASYTQGKLGRFGTGVSLNYRTDKINVYGDLNYYQGNNYKNENLFRDFPQVGYSMANDAVTITHYGTFSGKVGLDYVLAKNHTVGLLASGYKASVDMDLNNRIDFFSNAIRSDSSILTQGNGGYSRDTYNFNANYQGKIAKIADISVNATQTLYRKNDEQSLIYHSIDDQGSKIGKQRNIQTVTPSDVDITIAQADLTKKVTDDLKLEAGAKYTRIHTKNDFKQGFIPEEGQPLIITDSSQTGYDESIIAGYFIVNADIGQYGLQAGVRAEQTNTDVRKILERNFLDWFPSLSVARTFSDNYSLSLSYGRKIDRPIYDNLIPFRRIVDPYTIREGNPLLKPQYSHNIELANTFKDFTVLAGYTYTKDAMLDAPYQDEEVTIFSWRNFSRVETYNLSFILPLQLTSWWQSNNTVTGLLNRVKTSDENLLNFSKDVFSCLVNTTNLFSLSNSLKAELTGYYNSTNQYGIYTILPLYSVSVGIGKDILNKQGFLKLKLEDIFWSERYRLNTETGGLIQRINNLYDSRRVGISFTYKFGKQTVKKERDRKLGNETESNRLN